MYIKIYFGDKPLFLCDAVDETIQPFVHHDDAIFIDELNLHTIKTIIHEMETASIHAGVFYNEDLEALTKAFFKKFTLIQAAGGIVLNDKKECLLIFRKGKWDLPKGKTDNNEKLEDCAIREVKEETGLKTIAITSAGPVTYHTYHEGSRHILKESNWFFMSGNSKEELTPQQEEGISEIKWMGKDELKSILPKAYPLIADIISDFVL
jgi:ADP-ribose pyrophosphatase YjhB (NUDIX family)